MPAALALTVLYLVAAYFVTRARGNNAEVFGLTLVLGLGGIGWLIGTLALVGFPPGSLVAIPVAVCLLGIALHLPKTWSPAGKVNPVPVGLGAIPALIAVIHSAAVSTATDWDTLAYHLAVPKLWLAEGKITYIPFIHQSNFPFAIDALFLMGLPFGTMAAKIHTALLFVGGMAWVYGLAQRVIGERAAQIALLAFGFSPVVLFSSGSGYIDVGHGLFGAIGIWYAGEALLAGNTPSWRLAGLGLGLAMASKYSGLQTAFLVAVSVPFVALRTKQVAAKPLGIAVLVAVVLASPWMIRNTVNTGNPVYPFFYEQLGARGWDQFRADIYREEQKSFGIVEAGPMGLGAAVMGLAYQPGRYINPAPHLGLGDPNGALGLALFVGLLSGFIFHCRHATVRYGFAIACGALLLWFALSQQVRYLLVIAPLLALGLGSLSLKGKNWLQVGWGLAWLQVMITIGLLAPTVVLRDLESIRNPTDARARATSFSPAAEYINQNLTQTDKVALYDEVFGFLLDRPYLWANPGHSMLVPYEGITNGEELVVGLQGQNVTHVYLNLATMAPEEVQALLSAAAGQPGGTLPGDYQDLRVRWKPQLLDAVQRGLLMEPKVFERGQSRVPSGILWRIAPTR